MLQAVTSESIKATIFLSNLQKSKVFKFRTTHVLFTVLMVLTVLPQQMLLKIKWRRMAVVNVGTMLSSRDGKLVKQLLLDLNPTNKKELIET